MSRLIQLTVAANCLLALAACAPAYRNSPENAAKVAPRPSVTLEKQIAVDDEWALDPGVYSPLRRMGKATVYANKETDIRNLRSGRTSSGGFFWVDGAPSPGGYCRFNYAPMGVSGWFPYASDALKHIKR
ncbi:hypothetical protein OJ996_10980 [Luteolibacter sp. GHJ8]|uniref:Uncharacterized protein n=1 Tax=Luteolibacter rhizosphaerae TaxID=2989719 RepID=A0ABT3G366_9BACT|nr:hypothetical protein [Luteolibacter rhizosphaerae]MCW1914102.1 hypothetical protein [Luteolibacter rhizosphaerae]